MQYKTSSLFILKTVVCSKSSARAIPVLPVIQEKVPDLSENDFAQKTKMIQILWYIPTPPLVGKNLQQKTGSALLYSKDVNL